MIKIIKKKNIGHVWSSYFFPPTKTPEGDVEVDGYRTLRNVECEMCSDKYSSAIDVDDNYIEIIKQLKKANLLRKDYPLMCCRCFKRYE